MPIKYNLTKYDILAIKFHELVQKRELLTKDEETLKAEAVLVASLTSPHSWKTYMAFLEGNVNAFNSPEIKDEYYRAKCEKWKQVKNTDIAELAQNNIKDPLFITWLYVNVSDKNSRNTFRSAWTMLKQHINEECDGISVQRQR